MQIPYTFVVPGLILILKKENMHGTDCDTPSAKRLKMLIGELSKKYEIYLLLFVVDSRDKHYNFFCKEAGARI